MLDGMRGLLRPKPTLGLGVGRASPKDAQKALARALARQETRRNEAEDTAAVAVQLVGQITPAVDWPKLLAYWAERNPAGTASWPRTLDPGSFALNLWPLPPGRVGRAAGMSGNVRRRQPKKLLCTPGLLVFDPVRTDPKTTLAVLCATWLEDVGMDFKAVLLAPPVLETWAAGSRLIAREITDYGIRWQLPPADGATISN